MISPHLPSSWRRGAQILLLLFAWAWAPAARAGTCGVLPFAADGNVGRGAADNITMMVSTEADIQGGFELVLTAGDGEAEEGCGADPACIKSFGKDAGHEQVIVGRVKAAGEQYEVDAQVWEVRTGKMLRSVSHTMDRSADVLIDAIPALVVELLTGKAPAEKTADDDDSTPAFEAEFEEEDESKSALEKDQRSAEKPDWMKRDRHGRKIQEDEGVSAAAEEDPLGDLGDVDDVDLDGITADSQRRRAEEREEAEAREEARRQEEERLARIAAEEERRREEERRQEEERIRREREERQRLAAQEAERRRIEEQRMREEQARAREEEERRERARAEQERREREEREQLMREREQAERRQAEEERREQERRERAREERIRQEREEEEQRIAREQERRDREDEERERGDRERQDREDEERETAERERSDRERQDREDEERAAAERERKERERAERERRGREEEDAAVAESPREGRDRADREERQAVLDRIDRERREQDEEDDAGDDDAGGSLSLGSGLIVVEEADEEDVGFVIEDDVEDEDGVAEVDEEPAPPAASRGEEKKQLEPGQIIGEDDEPEDPGVARRRQAESDRYGRAREFTDRARQDEEGYRRSQDRRLAYNDDGAPSGGGGDEDEEIEDVEDDADLRAARDDERDSSDRLADRRRDRDYEDDDSGSSRGDAYGGEDDDLAIERYDDSSTRSGYSVRRDRTALASASRRGGPFVNVRAAAGWTLYYPQDLNLGMFDYGFEINAYALKALSIDVAADFWVVSLLETTEGSEPIRTVRTLPGFYVGVAWHGTFHKVVRPYAGVDLGAILYAQATRAGDQSGRLVSLFAPSAVVDAGTDFVLHRNLGIFLGVRAGVSHAPRIQETVNGEWPPTTGVLVLRAGALIQF